MADAPLVTPLDKTVLYLSRRSELRLTKKPRYPQRNPVSGVVDGYSPGEWIGFRDGQVRIPKTGKVQMQDSLDGGIFTADAAEVHEWLANHRLFGNQEEGFWRVDPSAPPVSQDEMRTMMEAALRLDEDLLREIIEAERAGWGREQIIQEAENALARIDQMKAAQPEPEEEPEPPKAKPGPKPKASGG